MIITLIKESIQKCVEDICQSHSSVSILSSFDSIKFSNSGSIGSDSTDSDSTFSDGIGTVSLKNSIQDSKINESDVLSVTQGVDSLTRMIAWAPRWFQLGCRGRSIWLQPNKCQRRHLQRAGQLWQRTPTDRTPLQCQLSKRFLDQKIINDMSDLSGFLPWLLQS